MGVPGTDPLVQLSLPPGFRFYPTDEELMVQYLCKKVAGHQFAMQIIGEIDLYKFDPWVLPSKALFGEKEWYFFSPRDRKYPNGSRPNRVAGTGYWKATGTDKVITSEGRRVGIKKALVFYVGRAPKGTKTNWIMHEYRLFDASRKNGSSKLDEWVLCRIYKKSSGAHKTIMSSVSSKEHSNNGSSSSSSSHLDDVLETLPEIDDRLFSLARGNSPKAMQNFNNMGPGSFEWASLAGFNSVVPDGQTQGIVGHANKGSDTHLRSMPSLCHVDSSPEKFGNLVEEEVQSGIKAQRVTNNSGLFLQNSGLLSQNFANSLDPYGFRYPNPFSSGFEFRQ